MLKIACREKFPRHLSWESVPCGEGSMDVKGGEVGVKKRNGKRSFLGLRKQDTTGNLRATERFRCRCSTSGQIGYKVAMKICI